MNFLILKFSNQDSRLVPVIEKAQDLLFKNLVFCNGQTCMIPLLQTKTPDSEHKGIFDEATKIFICMACPNYVGWHNLLVCQIHQYGGADCVPVVKCSKLIVSQPLPSETQFQFDFSM